MEKASREHFENIDKWGDIYQEWADSETDFLFWLMDNVKAPEQNGK